MKIKPEATEGLEEALPHLFAQNFVQKTEKQKESVCKTLPKFAWQNVSSNQNPIGEKR